MQNNKYANQKKKKVAIHCSTWRIFCSVLFLEIRLNCYMEIINTINRLLWKIPSSWSLISLWWLLCSEASSIKVWCLTSLFLLSSFNQLETTMTNLKLKKKKFNLCFQGDTEYLCFFLTRLEQKNLEEKGEEERRAPDDDHWGMRIDSSCCASSSLSSTPTKMNMSLIKWTWFLSQYFCSPTCSNMEQFHLKPRV